jgi:hypothetical protein
MSQTQCGNCGTTQGPFERDNIGTRKNYVTTITCQNTRKCLERRDAQDKKEKR